MSKISQTDIIGVSSALVSFAGIFAVVATIGIPTEVQRFLGKTPAEDKINDATDFFNASLILVAIGILACTITVLTIGIGSIRLFILILICCLWSFS
jgi:O-antigen/teichoic acid export membrane protein